MNIRSYILRVVELEKSISVRRLVEFVYQAGDLDLRFQGRSKMTDGIKVHQKIQKSQGEAYQAEVALKRTATFFIEDQSLETAFEIVLTVSGRADGVLKTQEGIVIDEIKGTGVPLEKIEVDTFPVHWAQAKIYGAIYCLDHALDGLEIQLTYADFEEEAIKRFKVYFSREALEAFWKDTLGLYEKWVAFEVLWKKKRTEGLATLTFPFSGYRQGQKRLAVSVFNTVRDSGILFAQAPTGIGKTLSTLFPVLKSMGTDACDRIFYLSAKSIAKGVAEESLELLRGHDDKFRLKSLTITAKDKVCINDQVMCYPEKCPYAKGHYDRVLEALWDIIGHEDAFKAETIKQYAQKHMVCPYEFSLDVALFSDCIVCDYNYALDPRVYLRRFFDIVTESYVFLIDEAHNLIDRSRTMYSAELHKNKITQLKKQVQPKDKSLKSVLEGINRLLLDVRRNCDEAGVYVTKHPSEDLYEGIKRRMLKYEKWLRHNPQADYHAEALDVYFDLVSYMRISELYEDSYLTYVTGGHTPETIYKLFCIHPAVQLKHYLSNAKAVVFFSATLSPLPYYQNMFCVDQKHKVLDLPSPFSDENRFLRYVTDVSVKYADRDASILSLCAYIYWMASAKIGNYMVFFPSYRYMDDCFTAFCHLHGRAFDTMKQSRQSNEMERMAFLKAFEHANNGTKDRSLVSFVVMGSHYSEGIDLQGDLLIGVMVVGVGLPMMNFESDLIKRYFDEKNGRGFEFAYQFPGVNKVMQSAGRVIRGDHDRGVIVLIDARYKTNQYKRYLPIDWGDRYLTQTEMAEALRDFWDVSHL